MIDFENELKKYHPVLEVDDLHDDVNGNGHDIRDILELLQYLSTKSGAPDRERD